MLFSFFYTAQGANVSTISVAFASVLTMTNRNCKCGFRCDAGFDIEGGKFVQKLLFEQKKRILAYMLNDFHEHSKSLCLPWSFSIHNNFLSLK